jgi:hypothetical protein
MGSFGLTHSFAPPADALPHLQPVGGPVHVVFALVPGRPVHSVRILDAYPLTPHNLALSEPLLLTLPLLC